MSFSTKRMEEPVSGQNVGQSSAVGVPSDNRRKSARLVDQKVTRGRGGEIHQARREWRRPTRLTTQQGVPTADDRNSLKMGGRGPALSGIFHLREKDFSTSRSRTNSRTSRSRPPASGHTAHFENYESLSNITHERIYFGVAGMRELLPFVRFSTVAETKRLCRISHAMFAALPVKLHSSPRTATSGYCREQHPGVFHPGCTIKFPDLIHAAKEEPDRGFPRKLRPRTTISGISYPLHRKVSIWRCGSCPIARYLDHFVLWKALESTHSASLMRAANPPS